SHAHFRARGGPPALSRLRATAHETSTRRPARRFGRSPSSPATSARGGVFSYLGVLAVAPCDRSLIDALALWTAGDRRQHAVVPGNRTFEGPPSLEEDRALRMSAGRRQYAGQNRLSSPVCSSMVKCQSCQPSTRSTLPATTTLGA